MRLSVGSSVAERSMPAGCSGRTADVSRACPPRVQRAVQRGRIVPAALDPTQFADMATSIASHLPLGDITVALPCSMMKCGDVLHRSTLDLQLRGEVLGPDWRTFALLGAVGAYLFVPPGVLPGAYDYYVLAKQDREKRLYGKDDIQLGRKLATGGFGTVYRGDLTLTTGEVIPVIVKKAKEFGQAEAYMNERMCRLPGKHVAEFITAFDETSVGQAQPEGKRKKGASPLDDAVWLVWRYEGDNTLFDLMSDVREFPYNMEEVLLDRELRLPRGARRKSITIRLVMKQLLEALASAHSTGIVHRDIKPQNCIVCDRDKKLKLIDLGAAADLRVGINYVPNEYLLDPRYAPPQQYVMSTQTPRPPPPPVAAFLSPILWNMEHPDRFDMYSCGVTLLQCAFPTLRNDNSLIAFNRRLEGLGFDLRAWRREEEARKGGLRPELQEGFELLDLDNRAGWELLCSLMAYNPNDRPSAAEALLSPFFGDVDAKGAALAASKSALSNATRAFMPSDALLKGIADEVTGERRGSLTEAQLQQELGLSERAPVAPRGASSTIVWWQERQSELKKSIEKRSSSSDGSQAVSGNKNMPRGGTGKARIAAAALTGNGNGASNGNGNGKIGTSDARLKAAGIAASLGSLFSVLPGPGSKGKPTEEVEEEWEVEKEEEEEEEREVVMAGQRQGPLGGLMGLLKRK